MTTGLTHEPDTEPVIYVTEISVPDFGDGGVQRLRSHFLQPETEIEAGQ
jgi:hypothetical protein